MKVNNTKKLKVSALAGILLVTLISAGYSLMNKDIILVQDGKEKQIATLKSNVKEVLGEQSIKYDSNDIVTVDLDSKLKDGMKIEVIDVTEELVRENKSIPFEVKIVEDSELSKGSTKVETEGKEGQNELIYKVVYHNGEQVEKKFIEELVSSEPESRLVKKGTKVEIQVALSRGETSRVNATNMSTNSSNSDNRKHMKVVATAYTGHTITSTGTTPKWGTIAVDPRVIPYGTKVYIPQFNRTFIAEDTGGAIKGNKIDIFMNDEGSVSNWGRKTIDIYIVG